MALQPGLVAAQAAFDLVGRLLETKIGFVRSTLGVQANPELKRNVQSERKPEPSRVITTWPPTEPLK